MRKIEIIVASFIILAVTFYILYPKYHFHFENSLPLRCNIITGKVDYFGISDGKVIGWRVLSKRSKPF